MTATRPGAIKEIFAAARGPAWTFSFHNGLPRSKNPAKSEEK
jgi:hypothetical protein